MQINHLPILWLPCAGMGLRVRRAKFRRVGHRFNRESCVGATVSCSKRLCHLVNCCAGSKGVLWLNRSWNKRALKECGRRRTHGTVQHMLLDISETVKVPPAVAQSRNSESLCTAPYFLIKYYYSRLWGRLWLSLSAFLRSDELLKSCEHGRFICAGSRSLTGNGNLPELKKWNPKRSEKLSNLTDMPH